MKDTEMHLGLSDETIRNFFSKLLGYISEQKSELIKREASENQDAHRRSTNEINHGYLRTAIEINDIRIRCMIESRKLDQDILAIIILIERQGWKEHDLSDYIQKTGNSYCPFIGTDAEAKILLSELTPK